MPFAPQTPVVDVNNPGRIGIATGRIHQIGTVAMVEVTWGQNEREFVPEAFLKPYAGQHASIEDKIDEGKFAGIEDLLDCLHSTPGGDRALTYPHAAVEYLGSSELEFRTFQRLQVALTHQLRLLKEGTKCNAELRMDLAEKLKETRNELRSEITAVTERAIALARPKLRRLQFHQMQILYGGGGCASDPYEVGIAAAFSSRWGLTAISQPLPVPNDVDWPANQGAMLFKRFSVAYGLSFFPTDAPIQRFPDEVGKLGGATERQSRAVNYAPSKDDV